MCILHRSRKLFDEERGMLIVKITILRMKNALTVEKRVV